MHKAAAANRVDFLKVLLDPSAQYNWTEKALSCLSCKTNKGLNVLHVAAMHADTHLLDYLIRKAGECLEDRCKRGMTPFLAAVHAHKIENAKLLIHSLCDVYARNRKLQNAMHLAVFGHQKHLL